MLAHALRLAALAVALAATPARAEQEPSCQGQDLVAKAKAERPEAYAAFEAAAQKVPNAEGLLWRVEGKGGAQPSYLFGTMHTTEPDLVALAEPLRAALKEVRTVAVELADAKGATAQAEMIAFVTRKGVDFSGKGLEGLDEAQAAEVRRRLEQAGMPSSIAPMLKPWFLGMTLQVSGCELRKMNDGKPTIDAVVEETAKAQGLKIVGLETVSEQLEAVSGVSEDGARRMNRDAVANASAGDDLQTTTLALYRDRRVGWYFEMKRETFGVAFDVSAHADFLEDIVDRRNRLMLDRGKPLIDAGPTLIAVGALHLPGKNGLVELFRGAGYTLTKVW